MKITQFTVENWTGKDGNVRADFIGLADDGRLYRWFRGKGEWVLYILESK